MMKIHLRQIENQLQSLIEFNATRLFPSSTYETDLVARLDAALQAGAKTGPNGRLIHPNLLIIETSLEQAQVLMNNQAVIDQLTQALYEHILDNGGAFEGPLAIRVIGSADVLSGEIGIAAYHSQEGLAQTSTLEPDTLGADESQVLNAYFIVDGTLIFDIKQSIVNIGRRDDNDLIIDDPRISRRHAQLRVARDKYILSDLNSTGGTLVNGDLIRQRILSPGDVISLSGVPLVFVQDEYGLADTQKNERR